MHIQHSTRQLIAKGVEQVGKLCMSCFESYSNEITNQSPLKDDNGIYYVCPRRTCQGKVVEIDDLLIPTIRLLNEKGYYTISSCSGHMEEGETISYIVFDETVLDIPDIPKGYQLALISENEGGKFLTIKKSITGSDSIQLFRNVLNNALMLYAWALKLPYAKELEEELLGEMFDDYYFFYWGEESDNSKKEDEEEIGSIDSEKIKKDIKEPTIKMKDFVKLNKNKIKLKSEKEIKEKDEKEPE